MTGLGNRSLAFTFVAAILLLTGCGHDNTGPGPGQKEIHVKCDTCDGLGYRGRCPDCGGSGAQVRPVVVYGRFGPVQTLTRVPCPTCGGSGKEICRVCGGRGTISKIVPVDYNEESESISPTKSRHRHPRPDVEDTDDDRN